MLADGWPDATSAWALVLAGLGLLLFRLAHVVPARLPIALPKWLRQRPASEGCIMAVLGSGELQCRACPGRVSRATWSHSHLPGGRLT